MENGWWQIPSFPIFAGHTHNVVNTIMDSINENKYIYLYNLLIYVDNMTKANANLQCCMGHPRVDPICRPNWQRCWALFFFFLSLLPLIFCAHFSLLLTKNIDIFMAKKLPILILIFLSIKISIFWACTLFSAQNIDIL